MTTVSPDSVAQDQIRAFVERIMRLREEAKAINGDIREVYAEAKGNGFDKTVLGKLVSYVEKRAAGATDLQEAEALFDLYLSAYDGATGTRVATHTHEAKSASNGAGGTEEAASVATYGAASSAQPISGSLRADIPEQTVQPDVAVVSSVVVPESVESSTGVEGDSKPSTHQSIAIATTEPPPSAGAKDDRGGEAPPPPASATVVTLQLRTHNPDTHFLNSHGLERLHGCQNPEVCGSGQPRVRLCFRCSVQHDGPAHGEVA